jgi:hypothetical protein
MRVLFATGKLFVCSFTRGGAGGAVWGGISGHCIFELHPLACSSIGSPAGDRPVKEFRRGSLMAQGKSNSPSAFYQNHGFSIGPSQRHLSLTGTVRHCGFEADRMISLGTSPGSWRSTYFPLASSIGSTGLALLGRCFFGLLRTLSCPGGQPRISFSTRSQ